MDTTTRHETREAWLTAGAELIAARVFARAGYDAAPVKVSVGFPAGSRGGQVIGQCWDASASEDKIAQVFIHPNQAEPVRVLGILAHEMIHAMLGAEAKHGPKFRQVALAIGLEGKMTATTEGEELRQILAGIVDELGEFPHARLDATQRKKQTTRLLKVQCGACGCIVRMTAKWLEQVGAPTCGCGGDMG